VICAVLALVVCAWFALGAHQAINTSRATSTIAGASKLSSTKARRTLDQLDNAGTLNPDRNVDILRAQTLLASGNAQAARRVLIAVTRDEPQNVDAWLALSRASGSNPPLLAKSLEQVRRLEPLLPFH
jgi:predicted Zn-dependent protease